MLLEEVTEVMVAEAVEEDILVMSDAGATIVGVSVLYSGGTGVVDTMGGSIIRFTGDRRSVGLISGSIMMGGPI